MKTYEQLMTHYWGVIVPMAQAAGIDPWECVRVTGNNEGFLKHPTFTLHPGDYTFALTVLDKVPVFVGDKLYRKYDGFCIEASVLEIDKLILSAWSLTPPTKKRTFIYRGDVRVYELDSMDIPFEDLPEDGGVIVCRDPRNRLKNNETLITYAVIKTNSDMSWINPLGLFWNRDMAIKFGNSFYDSKPRDKE